MKNVLIQMRPTRIEDLIAANAMYRPGPMELIPAYCARKNSGEQVPSVHPLVDDILAETYGIMVYQEQVMLVLNRLGQLPFNTALTLIKAISKKKESIIAAERSQFLQGARANGIAEEEAQRLFELILRFAGYGFNKAHATRYAIVAYQSAFFKVHSPREFLAATLTFESGDTDKVVQYLTEAQRLGIPIAPPDINTCDSAFTVDGDRVRFGLAAVKGVGPRAVEAIVAARQPVGRFTDLFHFCKHTDLRTVNRATIEALVKCGAFDSLGAHRAAMVAALDQAIELGQSAAADRRSGQMSFLEVTGSPDAPPLRFPTVEPWSEAQLLAAEKETLGFYVSSHPLVRYGRELEGLSTPPGLNLAHLAEFTGQVTVGCMIASVRTRITQNGRSAGRKMALLTLEDLTGKCDAVSFAETYEEFADLLRPEAMVFLVGAVDHRRERLSLVVAEVIPIDRALEELTGSLLLRLPAGAAVGEVLKRIHDVLVRHRGSCPVLVEMRPSARGDVRTTIRLDRQWFVRPTRRLVDELVGLLGEENLLLAPRRTAANGANGRAPLRLTARPAPGAIQNPALQSPAAGRVD
jgi:DNA polymerase-3 subunit alpha